MTRLAAAFRASSALSLLLAISPATADQALGPGYRTPTGAVYFRGSPSNFTLALPQACPANQWAMGSSTSTGLPICVQPQFSNVGGSVSAAQLPAFSGGDCTSTAGTSALICTKTNGVALGTAATANTGVSGNVVGRLNTDKTDSGNNVDTGSRDMSGASFVKVPTVATGTGGTAAASAGLVDAKIANALSSNSVLGFRNRIINSDDRIDQRNKGASQSIPTGSNVYTDDRFFVIAAGAAVTGQQVAGGTNATPAQFRYQFTGASGVTSITRCQRIEAANSFDMAGQTAIFSVDLADSLLTTINYSVGYASATDNFGTVTNIANGTLNVGSTLARYTTPAISIPAAATTGLQVCLGVGAQTSGTWTQGTWQFEMGSTATTFERRPYGFELAAAQRYLLVLGGTDANEFFATGTYTSTTAFVAALRFPVRMRAAPTFSSTAANTFLVNYGTVQGVTAISSTNPGPDSIGVSLSVAGPGASASGNFQANSINARLYFSAEL